MMHKFRSTRIWLCSGLLLAALVSQNAQSKTVLKLAHVGGDAGAMGAGAQRFAANLRKISNNQMDAEIFGHGVLGGIGEMWVQMRTGALDMQVIDIGAITRVRGAEAVNVMLTPFLFRDQAHLRRYLKDDLFLKMIKQTEASTRIHYLGIVAERSPRVISTTNKGIKSVADFTGVKMRVPKLPMFVEVFKSWGAIPIPVNPPEMFMALKTGLVEGEDNGVVNLVSGSLITVINHFTPINWLRTGVAAWIGSSSWQKLTEQEKTWVNQAVASSAQEASESFASDMNKAMEKLLDAGVTVHEPELDGFKAATGLIVDKYEGELWPAGEVSRIQNLQ